MINLHTPLAKSEILSGFLIPFLILDTNEESKPRNLDKSDKLILKVSINKLKLVLNNSKFIFSLFKNFSKFFQHFLL